MGGKRKRGAKEGPGANASLQKRAKNDVPVSNPDAERSKSKSKPKPKPNLEKTPFVENPIGDERKREAGLYELLGSEDENERIEAADCIISSLFGEDGVPEVVLERHLSRRLFRGLASGRNASRIGFSLVITEILDQMFGEKALAESAYPGLTFEKVVGLLTEKTQAVGNIPGQEERDHYFGQLFGIESLVRSHVLFTDISRWNLVLDLLLKLSNKKIWLRSQCGWVLIQALREMSEEDAKLTLEQITEAGISKTPEGVACWLVALERFPKLQVKPWRSPLHSKSLGDLAAVLKESFNESAKDPGDKSRNTAKHASWTAQLHFVWDIILAHYIQEGNAGADEFEQFWNRVVDDGLFSRQATDGQKFKGFMVFQKMLEGLVNEHAKLKALFSKNFMTCLMNQAAKEDRYLHRAASKALKAIEGVVAYHPTALVSILENILGTHGAYNFDQRTASKTVDKLLQNITKESEDRILAIIRQPLASLAQQEDSVAQNTLRVYVEYLSKILNASASSTSGEAVLNQKQGPSFGLALQELSRLAYTQPGDIPSGVLTGPIQELCRSRLESSLAKLTRRADDFVIFCKAVASIDLESVNMAEEVKTAMEDALSRMHKLLKRKSKGKEDKSLAQGLAMLHAISLFQLYNEDPDAMEVISDLSQYYDRLKAGDLGKNNAGSSELLVEILLSMIARPSSLMRQVSQQVFETFTSQISAKGLELLTDPLASGESAQGQKQLFDTEEDAMDVDEGDSSDDDDVQDVEEEGSDFEVDSDVEFVELNGENVDDSSDEDEEEEEESESEGEDEDEEETDDKEKKEEPTDLDELFGNILKSHRLDKDVDAASSSSEGDMSDSEMLAMDGKLEEVFKQQRKAKPNTTKQKKDAKQSVVNFKHRILDLLDIYVKNEALNPLAFSLLMPLLHLMRTTTTKPLATRACEIILNFQKGLKKARSSKEDAEQSNPDNWLALLVEVHDEAGKDNSHAFARASSAASLIIVSAMFATEKNAVKEAAAVYAKTQSDWVLGEVKLQNSFFADWNNWCQNHASQARN